MLKIYNTLTGNKEIFKPMMPGKVSMYVCGVTVYDVCHIGHARSALVFDVIRRYMDYKGFEVTYVKNFTDVDDKIILRAQKEGVGWKEIAERYIEEYNRDMELLGIKKADIEPKATDHIEDMQGIINGLIKKGHAYRTNGDVYYRVKSFDGYGRLSGRNTEEMLAGARVEVDEKKEDPLDFALWKSSKPGEPEWSSPWGGGRPGWHIECSAMSMKYLGLSFDIHGGGKDLIFPHHENEIAQSEAYTEKTFARYWIHNGFVNVNQEKMSKSLGNFFTISEVFEKYPYSSQVTAEVLRYFLISKHYRSPVDFSDRGMSSSHAALDGFYAMFQKLREFKGQEITGPKKDQVIKDAMAECKTDFIDSMDDDFNTAAAIAGLQKLKKEVNTYIDKGISFETATEVEEFFRGFGYIPGLFSVDSSKWEYSDVARKIKTPPPSPPPLRGRDREGGFSYEEINKLVAEREEARKNKEWKKSDEIRKMLADKDIILEDRPDGTTRIKH